MRPHHHQFIKFAAIGVANTLLHGLVLGALVDGLGWPVMLSHLLAFCAANLCSYLLNSYVTFKSPVTPLLYARFLLASLLSLALTLSLSGIAQWSGLGHWQGFALIVLLVPLFSFGLMKFWTFRKVSSPLK